MNVARNTSTPLPWAEEVARFFATLKRFDDYLASDAPLACYPEDLFQGPIADALNHVGQIGDTSAANPIWPCQQNCNCM